MEERPKILIIDDDPDVQRSLRELLEANAYRVAAAYDSDEGLQKVVDERPDLIILDVMMPGKDGFQACHELKTDPKYYFFSKIPVLMVTVYPEDRDKARLSVQEGVTMEADDYLQKPFEPEELLKRIRYLLSR